MSAVIASPQRPPKPLLLCLSHLRWDFVHQRPQHLLARAARDYAVVFLEEPLPAEAAGAPPALELRRSRDGVLLATPRLPGGLDAAATDAAQRRLLDQLLDQLDSPLTIAWFYTPMALAFAGHLEPEVVIYDCMDELSAFCGASPRLELLERQLFKRADLVFTGGRSLHEAKRRLHPAVHLFPSSVDAAHFRAARGTPDGAGEPADQAGVPHPRIGFFGVIDERMDYDLVSAAAERRPDWHFVMLGPTAKVDPAALPRRPNLHWLWGKSYAELPRYLAGWDAGWMPFALNEATRYISPTKTPEFLAAGVPLVSTPVADVVADWGKNGLVEIADGPDATVRALDAVMARPFEPWLARVDQRLSWLSWDTTWSRMNALIQEAAAQVRERQIPSLEGSAHV